MRLPITLTTAALAVAFAAGPAQAEPAPSTPQASSKGVVVLIGANDYGLTAPAQAFTPPIGTDKGSVTAAPPTTAPNGIIAILIG